MTSDKEPLTGANDVYAIIIFDDDSASKSLAPIRFFVAGHKLSTAN